MIQPKFLRYAYNDCVLSDTVEKSIYRTMVKSYLTLDGS